jgi:glucoamylase
MFLVRGSQIALFRFCVGVLMCFIVAPGTCARADNAPDGAGQDPFHWSPSSKQFLGTAANNNSLVYFTGAQGILTEIFYPSPDSPQNVDLQLIVEDAGGTLDSPSAEEKQQNMHTVHQVDPRAMLWQVTTTANTGALP